MAQAKKRLLVDEIRRKTSIVPHMNEYRELPEDLQDLAVIAERKEEPSEPLEVLRKRLDDKWQ